MGIKACHTSQATQADAANGAMPGPPDVGAGFEGLGRHPSSTP